MSCTVFHQELQTHVNELVMKQLALMRGYFQAVLYEYLEQISKSFQCSSFVENIKMSSIIILYLSLLGIFSHIMGTNCCHKAGLQDISFPFANIHMSMSHNTVLTRNIFGILQPEAKCDMHLLDRECS